MTRFTYCDECGTRIEEDKTMHIKVSIYGTYEQSEDEDFDLCSWKCFDKKIAGMRETQ